MHTFRRSTLLFASLFIAGAATASADPPPGGDGRLPPRLEQVLADLSIDDVQRAAVRELLHERRAQRQRDRDADRAALRKLLSNDQAVAIEAALPPPGGPRHAGVRDDREDGPDARRDPRAPRGPAPR